MPNADDQKLSDCLDPFFDASSPDVMPRNKLLATLPIAFLDELYATTTLDELLELYTVWTRRIIGSENCNVGLLKPDGTLDITIGGGSRPSRAIYSRSIKGSVVGEVMTRSKGLFIPDLRMLPPGPAQSALRDGFLCAYFAPIVSGSTRFGTLNAHFRVVSAEPGRILTILEAMAGCLGSRMMLLEQMRRLEDIARTDPLTGVRNRRAFDESVPERWQSWTRTEQPFSIVTLDIDHFKQINDNHGHSVGDQVLIQLAERVGHALRRGDTVFRLGGEEFGILLPQTHQDEAACVATRVYEDIRETSFQIGSLTVPLTVCIGLANPEFGDLGHHAVIERADAALYHGKRNGRDRIIQASGEAFQPLVQAAA